MLALAGPIGIRALLLVAGCLILAVSAGCERDVAGDAPASQNVAPPSDPPPRPNIILISIDSLRADHLGSWGYERDTSPAIDALAADGVLFENAAAQAPWTLPSHASLLTGLYGRTHQAVLPKRRLAADAVTLASVLKAAGYRTHAIVSGPFMHRRFGLDRGFDAYDDELAQGSHRASHRLVNSPDVHARAVRMIETLPRPFFLFLHYWDVHYDYVPPPPYDTRFDPDYAGDISPHAFMFNNAIRPGMDARDLEHIVALYDGEIAWVDEYIGRLIGELKRRGLYEDSVVVVTADHGDEFFEHGQKGHQHALYEESLHVPLVMRFPGQPAGVRVPRRVQLIDVMPTLLEMLGVDGAATQGRSLWPLVRGEEWAGGPVFSETMKARKSRRERKKCAAWCVYDETRKLIRFENDRYPPEVYDLMADPGEQRNMFDAARDADLVALLEKWFVETPEQVGTQHEGLDPDMLRTLQSLGYVGDDADDEDDGG